MIEDLLRMIIVNRLLKKVYVLTSPKLVTFAKRMKILNKLHK